MKVHNSQRPKDTIGSVGQLNQTLPLSHGEVREIEEITRYHPMAITPHYLNLISPGDPDDPIRKMAVPSPGEMNLQGSFDTSGEQENTKLQGLQHKYGQTALVLITNQCAMYCRYCFRKRLVGVAGEEIATDWPAIIDYIEAHEEINNVLLSGGDALTVSTAMLAAILARLVEIPHLSYIRIGSRIPVVQPSRINDDDELVKILRHYGRRKRIYVTTQFNHPQELARESLQAVRRLQRAGVVVNNQAVLLKDVNDDPAVMAELMVLLTRHGVVPYYIFQCRPVSRVKDAFQIPLPQASDIIEQVRMRLDGLSKRFRFIMSHKTGKVEILGRDGTQMFFKYHQAKEPNLAGRLFCKEIRPDQGWLSSDEDDEEELLPCQE
ncbi:MAG: KamA family radical SAM protein [Desulfurivibrionaceae bacterium]|nr:KamA family radical SAM protein [Desulfurivibrionaceae bacterium]